MTAVWGVDRRAMKDYTEDARAIMEDPVAMETRTLRKGAICSNSFMFFKDCSGC